MSNSLPFFVIALLFIFLFAVKPDLPDQGLNPGLRGTPMRMFLRFTTWPSLAVMVFTSLATYPLCARDDDRGARHGLHREPGKRTDGGHLFPRIPECFIDALNRDFAVRSRW